MTQTFFSFIFLVPLLSFIQLCATLPLKQNKPGIISTILAIRDNINNNTNTNTISTGSGGGGGLSTSDKIAIGVGLGVGIPSLIAAVLGVYYARKNIAKKHQQKPGH